MVTFKQKLKKTDGDIKIELNKKTTPRNLLNILN